MKVTLQNFKCWEDQTFDFGDNGITLLSGKSGIGKTSILQAIIFALFGIGNKVVMHERKSCKVVFEYDKMKIERTKGPCRLLLNDSYEDDAAQEIINKKFGKHFKITGYMEQGSHNSFALMNPTEKLEFLETIALRDTDIKTFKEKTKELIKERNDDLLKLHERMSTIKEVLEDKEEPEQFEMSFKCRDENIDELLKKITTKKENIQKRICKINEGLKLLRDSLVFSKVYESQVESLTQQNSSITDINNSLLERFQISFDDLQTQKQKLKSDLETSIKYNELKLLKRKYDDDLKKYNALLESETNEKQSKIDEITSKLWKEYSKEDIDDNIDTYKDLVKDLQKVDDLTQQMSQLDLNQEDYETMIDELTNSIQRKEELVSRLTLEKETYICPDCDTRLVFKDGKLVKNNHEKCANDLDKETDKLASMKKKLSKLSKKYDKQQRIISENERLESKKNDICSQYEDFEDFTLSECKSELESYIEYKTSNINLENKLEDIRSNGSSVLVSLKTDLDILETKLSEFTSDIEIPDIDHDEIKDKLREFEKIEENQNLINDNIQKLETLEKEFISNHKKVRKSESITNSITKYEGEIQDYKSQHSDVVSKIDELRDYIRNRDEIKEYYKWSNEYDRLEKDEKVYRDKLTATNTLKEKIKEAESIAVSNIMDTINTTVDKFLSIFFPNDPIDIQVLPFKTTKKSTKPQINLSVNYKGVDCDLNSLSGGELQRVIVAFNLALSEIFNLPFILLDECTSNLDQESTNIIVNGIKTNFENKNVIIIAHQVVSGIFDKVIKI